MIMIKTKILFLGTQLWSPFPAREGLGLCVFKTKRGKRPRIVLKQAAEELQKESSEFKKLIDEAL